MRELYPFQKDAATFHLSHHYSLNCSEMGTGKSAMALSAAKESGLKIAVFAPPFLKSSWQAEARVLDCQIEFYPYSKLATVNASKLAESNFWIVDEIHYLKTPTAQRTQKFYSLLKSIKPKYFLGLTGTPIRNRVPDFWTLIGFCGVNPMGTSGKTLLPPLNKYHGFCRHFCNMEEVFLPMGRRATKYTTLRLDREAEFKSYLTNKMIRFRVNDVLKDLPEMTRKEVYIPLKEPDGLHDEFHAYMSGHKTNSTGKKNSALVKSQATAAYCKEILDADESIVVFSDHVDAAKEIHLSFGSKISALITGGSSIENRQRHVEDFQAGKIKALVATIGALSVGVTLHRARHVVFNDLSWVPADNLQAEKRIHRIGQKSACFSHYIVSSPTDSYIQKTLVSKLDTINKVLEDKK